MAGNRIICNINNVDYITIRKAMCQGARTMAELQTIAGVCLVCENCKRELENILQSVCGCREIALETVVNAVKNGADTVEKVSEMTGAGTGENCGRCKLLIENIIEIGK